eukprot:TRINITY_DN44490_c0_g1_i1.p1 TRINITY_DN44490_c0_g1~~TRINITY_DN44490_c0_g1_i1.p1  ORF type:complete len:234 (-),score=43.63 TRINITY_DN44490_c0_g1_i1:313-954(-)
MMSTLFVVSALTLAAVSVSAEDKPYLVDFSVKLAPGKEGTFTIEVHPEWAPLGAARFKELIDADFFKNVRFFRAIKGFMAQFGIHGNPGVAAKWRDNKISDDPVKESNKRGYLSFATSGKDSRTTQMFINFGDNTNLDGMGFSPFARVISGMDVVDELYTGYGEGGSGDGTDGRGPSQGRLQSEGNKYLKKVFPKLSYILTTTVRGAAADEEL